MSEPNRAELVAMLKRSLEPETNIFKNPRWVEIRVSDARAILAILDRPDPAPVAAPPHDLAGLAAMCAKYDAEMTPGEWTSDGKVIGWLCGEAPGVAVRYWQDGRGSPVCMCQPHLSGKYGGAGGERPVEDAAGIAALRNAAPQLADALERAAGRVKELEAGLRPFARLLPACGEHGECPDQWPLYDAWSDYAGHEADNLNCGHVRRAAALLAAGEAGEK